MVTHIWENIITQQLFLVLVVFLNYSYKKKTDANFGDKFFLESNGHKLDMSKYFF